MMAHTQPVPTPLPLIVLIGLVPLMSGLQEFHCDPSSHHRVNLLKYDYGSVTSLNYPGVFPVPADCVVELYSVTSIKVTVRDVSLIHSDNCAKQYLEISDGLSSEKFCGAKTGSFPKDLLLGKNVKIILHTDGDIRPSLFVEGFKLIFNSTLPSFECGETSQINNVMMGFITSPHYPGNSNGQNCEISVLSTNKPIRLINILYVYSNTNTACSSQLQLFTPVRFTVKDNTHVVETITQRPLRANWTYTSSSAHLSMSLTGSCPNFKSFKFFFQVLEESPSLYELCQSQSVTEPTTGVILSPYYPSMYNEALVCSVNIQTAYKKLSIRHVNGTWNQGDVMLFVDNRLLSQFLPGDKSLTAYPRRGFNLMLQTMNGNSGLFRIEYKVGAAFYELCNATKVQAEPGSSLSVVSHGYPAESQKKYCELTIETLGDHSFVLSSNYFTEERGLCDQNSASMIVKQQTCSGQTVTPICFRSDDHTFRGTSNSLTLGFKENGLFAIEVTVVPLLPVNCTAVATVMPMSESSDVGGIVGGVLGGLLVVAVAIVIVILYLRYKRRQDSSLSANQTALKPLRIDNSARQGSVHDYDYVSTEFRRRPEKAFDNSAELYTSYVDENELATLNEPELTENDLYTNNKRLEDSTYMSASGEHSDQPVYSGLYESNETTQRQT